MLQLRYKLVGMGLNFWSFIAPNAAAQKAYQLFGRTAKAHIREKEADFLATGVQINSKIGEHDVVEYHWGKADGPLVLLTYGWNYNAGRWRHFVPDLVKAGFHVLAYDPPGHGKNQSSRFLNIVINSSIQQGLIYKYGRPEVLIGHSFGGACAVYSIQQLESEFRPKRTIIMASFSLTSRVLAEYKKMLGLWPGLYYQMIRNLEKNIGKTVDSFDMARMSSAFGDLKCLLVYDPQEKVTPFYNGLRYHNYWPNSLLLHADGAGHHLGTRQVTEDILNFAIKGESISPVSINTKPIEAGA